MLSVKVTVNVEVFTAVPVREGEAVKVGTADDVLVTVAVFVSVGGVPVHVSVIVAVFVGLWYGVFVTVTVRV
jgi:hypothetical protein